MEAGKGPLHRIVAMKKWAWVREKTIQNESGVDVRRVEG